MAAKQIRYSQDARERLLRSGRAALQNAASVASLLLTTEALIAEKPKKKVGGGGMPGMGDAGM